MPQPHVFCICGTLQVSYCHSPPQPGKQFLVTLAADMHIISYLCSLSILMVVEILNADVGRKGTARISQQWWLVLMLHLRMAPPACPPQPVFTAKISCRYNTVRLSKRHMIKNLPSTTKVRAGPVSKHEHSRKGCICTGSPSNVPRDCGRAESSLFMRLTIWLTETFSKWFSTKLLSWAGAPSRLEQ